MSISVSDLKAELKAVLEKYDCAICFEYDPLGGKCGERMQIVFRDKVVFSCDGYVLNSHTLGEYND